MSKSDKFHLITVGIFAGTVAYLGVNLYTLHGLWREAHGTAQRAMAGWERTIEDLSRFHVELEAASKRFDVELRKCRAAKMGERI